MRDEHKIIQQVYAAKEDVEAADRLIGIYMPFIKAETAKYLKRPPVEGHDDELSIAMIAFHEAIGGYSRARGAFLKSITAAGNGGTAAPFRWTRRRGKRMRRFWIRCRKKGITRRKCFPGTLPVRKSRS